MQRYRLVTLLALTSLVATMLTISRYSVQISEDANHQRRLSYVLNKMRRIQKIAPHHSPLSGHNASINRFPFKQTRPLFIAKINKNVNRDFTSESIVKNSKLSEINVDPETNYLSVDFNKAEVIKSFPQTLKKNSETNRLGVARDKNNDERTILSSTNRVLAALSSTNSVPSSTLSSSAVDIVLSQLQSTSSSSSLLSSSAANAALPKPSPKATGGNQSKTALSPSSVGANLPKVIKTKSSSAKLTKNKTSNTQTPIRPRLIFTGEDLKTTETLVIDKANFCDSDKGATLDLLVVVTSAVDHFKARQAIRKTWGAFAIERGAFLLFLLGSPSPNASKTFCLAQNTGANSDNDNNSDLQSKCANSNDLQQQIVNEDKQFGDILQGSFMDNYFNLTLKTITLMRWVSLNCDKVKFVLKVDDDMFVNMQLVVDFSETRTFTKSIIGTLSLLFPSLLFSASSFSFSSCNAFVFTMIKFLDNFRL